MRNRSTTQKAYRAAFGCFVSGAGLSLFGYLSNSFLWYAGLGLGSLGLLFALSAVVYGSCEQADTAYALRAFLDQAFHTDYLFKIASYWSDRPAARRSSQAERFEHKGLELGTPGSAERITQCGYDSAQ